MKTLLTAYYIAFALMWWPWISHNRYHWHGLQVVAADVAGSDADPHEGLRLMNTAALESGFDPTAVGKHGERGAFQVMPPAASYGADEALRRMRHQGMVGFVGCRHAEDEVVIEGVHTTCAKMIDNRTWKADLYFMAFDPPVLEGYGELAGKP